MKNPNVVSQPDKLSKDLLFGLSLWGGIIIGFVVAIIILIANDIYNKTCFEPICFSQILIIFELPIKIAAAGITLSGLRALVFRSNQTWVQIENVIKQNKISNFLEHKKQFLTLLDGLENQYSLQFYSREQLYSKLFPDNSFNNVEFESRDIDSKKSPLEFLIESYTSIVKKFDCLVKQELGNPEVKDLNKFGGWLSNFVILQLENFVSFKKTRVIKEEYFHDKDMEEIFKKVPEDLKEAFYHIERCYEAIVNYCLPSKASSIKIPSPNLFHGKFNFAIKTMSLPNNERPRLKGMP